MIKIEKRIVINNGVLSMADGSDLKSYLMEWQIEQQIKNGQVINVIDTETLERMKRYTEYCHAS